MEAEDLIQMQMQNGNCSLSHSCTERISSFHLQSKTSSATTTNIKFKVALFQLEIPPSRGVSNDVANEDLEKNATIVF